MAKKWNNLKDEIVVSHRRISGEQVIEDTYGQLYFQLTHNCPDVYDTTIVDVADVVEVIHNP